jgi:hypothetical protein
MSTRVNSALLDEAAKKLQMEWQQTRTMWTDAKSLEFQKMYLEPLPSLVAQAGIAVEEMNALLTKVRHDCE